MAEMIKPKAPISLDDVQQELVDRHIQDFNKLLKEGALKFLATNTILVTPSIDPNNVEATIPQEINLLESAIQSKAWEKATPKEERKFNLDIDSILAPTPSIGTSRFTFFGGEKPASQTTPEPTPEENKNRIK